MKYNDISCIYRSTLLRFNFDGHNKVSYGLDIFDSLWKLIDEKIRYCPTCIKQGYHSIHHQLIFLDKCPIHKKKLVYMCNCNESYMIQSAGRQKAYSCHICRQELNVPDVKDSILKQWGMPITKIRVKHNNIDKIFIIDFYDYIINNDKKCNNFSIDNRGKKILKELYLKGSTEESRETYYEEKDNKSNTLNIQTDIHCKIIEKYGEERYIQNASLINEFFKTSINEYNDRGIDVDIDLISAIFLLRDLLSIYKVRKLYNYNYSFDLKTEHKNSTISVLQYIDKILEDNIEDGLRSYICNEIVKECFNQIKRIINESGLIPAQYELLEYENAFSIFIIVKENNGNNLLYRCGTRNKI
ncbi:hypothetical protein [Tissierella sp.]|uniref:hypothetical protein n=1 Tax=Tissierella sp. TaxID=41274 RepID=UPI003060B8C1